MPYINLGNIRPISQDVSVYTHTFDEDSLTHNFSGNGIFGYCKCVANWEAGHKVAVNGTELTSVSIPRFIADQAWIIFALENNGMYIFDKSEMFNIPDGEVVMPTDDPEIWCACAGINYHEIGRPDVSTLVNSDTYCQALFNSENAFAYYRRSSQLIKDTMALGNVRSCIEAQNPYVTPIMTGLTTPAGYTASFSGGKDNGYGMWGGQVPISRNTNPLNSWCQLILPEAIWPYKMQGTVLAHNLQHRNYGTITVSWQCSEDGVQWTTIDTVSVADNDTDLGTQYWYNYAGLNKKYKYFRFYYDACGSATYDSDSYDSVVRYFHIHGIL